MWENVENSSNFGFLACIKKEWINGCACVPHKGFAMPRSGWSRGRVNPMRMLRQDYLGIWGCVCVCVCVSKCICMYLCLFPEFHSFVSNLITYYSVLLVS